MYVDERTEHIVQVTASQQVPNITSQAYDDVTLEEVCAAKNIPAYLDGCRIYLGDGLDDKRLALLKRLILVAGGTRFSDHYDGDVTHFVVHNQVLSAKELDQLKRYQNQPLVIHDQWLLACFVAKARLEPDVYRIDPALIYRAMRGNVQNSQATTLGSGSQPQGRSSSSLWATKRSSQSMLQASSNQQNIPPPPQSANWMVPHKKERLAIDTPPDSVPTKALFKSLSLYLHPKLHKQHHDRIVALGGTVKDSFDQVDYAVYPTVCAEDISGAGCKVVNEIWLSECMAEKRLLATDDQRFFAPIFTRRPIDTNDFRSLYVCPTGFSIPERDYFACLLSGLGGGFSEAFSKKNTHLLCKSGALLTGPKIDFALKTGIPCVTEQWLLDSAREGCVLPLDLYKVRTSSKCLGPVAEANEANPEPQAKKARFDGPVPLFKSTTTSNLVTPKQGITPRLEAPSAISATSEPKSLLALSVDTPIRRDFKQRIIQVTDDLLPKPDPDRPSLGPTQAILKESISSLLNGLVFTISQRLWHRREELHDLVTTLGGTFLWTYDGSCTHYLHQGNQVEESFKEFRVARHSGKKIVSPAWLDACKEERKRLPEDEFPHFYPNNASDLVKAKKEEVPIPRVPSVPVLPIDTGHERRASIAVEPPVDVPETFAATLDLALPVNGLRKTNRVVTYAGINCSDDEDARPVPVPTVDRPSSTEGISQGALGLTLDDSKTRRFMLSAVTASEKTLLTEHLKSLGASISDQVEWDSTVTHLVVKQVTKSEKYLAACAAGIWVLRPEYIEACATAGRFLAESEYEVQPAWTDTTADGAIKGAPKAWRMHLGTTGKKGAFDGWTVLLAVDAKRLPGFSRILKAGHAQVYTISDIESDTSLQASKCTHVITSSHAMRNKIPQSFSSAFPSDAFKGIEFIAEHLLSPPRL